MVLPKQFALLFILIGLLNNYGVTQYDSVSSITISEYRDNKLITVDYKVQNFIDNKLIYEYKKNGINREDSEIEMKTNFYDLNGNLTKTILVEEDEYKCPPEPIYDFDEFPMFTVPVAYLIISDSNSYDNIYVIPDSVNNKPEFCGRYLTKTIHYYPYSQVEYGMYYYDQKDTSYFTESLIFDRYKDITKKVSYLNEVRYLEYRYYYKRDAKGRVIEKRWENITSGEEFSIITRYMYNGEHQLPIYNSFIHYNKQPKLKSSKTYYNSNFKPIKHENYIGDSLSNVYYYFNTDQIYKGVGVNSKGDTINVSEFVKIPHKNGSQSWSHQTIRSEEYMYSAVDTVCKRKGYLVKSKRFRITKEQFVSRSNKLKIKNQLLHKQTKHYDKYGRLQSDIEYDLDSGTSKSLHMYRVLE